MDNVDDHPFVHDTTATYPNPCWKVASHKCPRRAHKLLKGLKARKKMTKQARKELSLPPSLLIPDNGQSKRAWQNGGFQSLRGRSFCEVEKMKKLCEFCSALRPVVYCKADAAHLCLFCDAKVHSANTLFNRHLRTILCDSCRYRPAYVQCLDHKMFMCGVCERTLHIASQHQKRAISNYTGCPSAKDFAALWGFKLNELDNTTHLDGTLSTSCGSSCDSSAVNLDSREQSCSLVEGFPAANSPTLAPGVESEVGSSNQQYKISHEGQGHKSTSFILHQLLDLKRLQLTEGSSHSLLIRGKEQSDLSSSLHHTSKRFDDNLDQSLQHSEITRFRQRDSLRQDLKVNGLAFPFSQLEHMPPSSTVGLPLDTESFWHCGSPVESCQLWAQNMQDIGVCEELVCNDDDDFNIPDVDMTFRNFEELFGGEQDPTRALLDDKDVSYSSLLKDISLDKSDNGHARATRMENDASEVSCIFINEVQNLEGSVDYCPCPIRSSSSTSSFCMSRFSAESSGNDCHDSWLSPYISTGETLRNSPHDQEGGRSEARANAMTRRYKEKKHSPCL